MKGMGGALAVLMVVSGCTSTSTTASTPSPTPTPLAAHFERYVGAYRTTGGVTFVINGHGHLLNLRDSTFRQLYPTATPDRLVMGRTFAIPVPTEAAISFRMVGNRADQFTMRPAGRPAFSADRLRFKETDVQLPVNGATLAATITEPLTPALHPGIVIVHGSGLGPRIDYGIWVGLYASLGMTVLAYDKRGNGQSTGTYPGEFPTEDNLNIYAADAAAVLRYLGSWPGVDPNRVGFHGGSQGGWTVPLAIQRFHAPAAFALLASAPAVSVDQQGFWASAAESSTTVPALTPDLEAQLRAVPASTYDSGPALAAMRQPALWYNGASDRTVPTEFNAELLRGVHHPNWDIEILPGVDHGLFENPTGLEKDELSATRLASGLWVRIAAWLHTNAGTPLSAARP
jgi:dienelactone hydrolase